MNPLLNAGTPAEVTEPGEARLQVPSGCPDLNWGPLRPERSALPGCATPRTAKVSEWLQRASVRHVLGTVTARIARYVVSIDNKGGNVNVVTLIGNLSTDVEVRELGEERKVANFVLAVDRLGPNKEADFISIAAWNKQAELCSRFLAKGKRVAVDGRLRSRSWDDADGKRRSAVEVVARSVQFLSPPDGAAADKEVPFEAAVAS